MFFCCLQISKLLDRCVLPLHTPGLNQSLSVTGDSSLFDCVSHTVQCLISDPHSSPKLHACAGGFKSLTCGFMCFSFILSFCDAFKPFMCNSAFGLTHHVLHIYSTNCGVCFFLICIVIKQKSK